MERQLERSGGFDVHKDTVATCVRVGGRTGRAEHARAFHRDARHAVRGQPVRAGVLQTLAGGYGDVRR